MKDLSKIVSIRGKAGLFEVLNSKNNTMIARSINDLKTIVTLSMDRVEVIMLNQIEVFCNGNNILFEELYNKIKDDAALSSFEKPFNFSNVREWLLTHHSDLKMDKIYDKDIEKIILWSQILNQYFKALPNEPTS